MPLISHLFGQGNRAQMAAVTETAQRWSLFLTLPPAICLIALSPDIIRAIYGESFLAGSLPLSIIACTAITGAFASMLVSALSAMRRVKEQLAITVACGSLGFVLSVFLIPAYGMAGAACSTLITSTISSMAYFIVARRYMDFRVPRETFNLQLAGLLALALIFLLNTLVPPFPPAPAGQHFLAAQAYALAYALAKVGAAFAIFLAAAVGMRCFRGEDLGVVKKVLARARIPPFVLEISSRILAAGISR